MITITSKSGSVDLVKERGIHVALRGIEEFLSYPPTKKPTTIDWYEVDGVEVDLSELYLDKRVVKIPLTTGDLNALTKLASDLKEWQVMELTHHTGISRKVYFESATLDKAKFTLNCRFVEFAPKAPEGATPKTVSGDFGEQPTIDRKPITEFGFLLLKSDADNVTRAKRGTIIATKFDDGITYLERTTPRFATRKAVMKLFSSGPNCIENYKALVGYLLKQKECTLNGTHKCYLNQAKVEKYHQPNAPYIVMNLELQLI